MSCNCNPYVLREKYAGFFMPIKKTAGKVDPEKEAEKKLRKGKKKNGTD